jgi:hypothetical protein
MNSSSLDAALDGSNGVKQDKERSRECPNGIVGANKQQSES